MEAGIRSAALGFRAVAWGFLLASVSACESEKVLLSIFHTNDIHSRFNPPPADPFALGGIARLSTLYSRLKGERPNAILLDAGDFSEGSWYYNIDTGANMLRLMDTVGYDAVAVGNHDYLSGPDRLLATVKEAGAGFPILAANFDFSSYSNEAEFRAYIPPSVVIERGGVLIGLIGLTTVDYSFATYLKPLQATDPVAAAQEEARKLIGSVDVIIIVSHNSFDTNRQIARAVNGVHAVISGHSHVKLAHAELVENAGRLVPVVETGKWGSFLGELALEIDKKSGAVTYLGSELHPVGSDSEADPVVQDMVDTEHAKLEAIYGGDVDEVIAESEVDFSQKEVHRASLLDLATKAYRAAASSDVGVESSPFIGTLLPAGPMTVFGLHDVMPHVYDLESGKEWTVKVWHATGEDLGLLVNTLYTGSNLIPYVGNGLLGFDGLEVDWEPASDGGSPIPVIHAIRIGGENLEVGRRYTVAMTDGLILALEVLNDLIPLGLDLSQIDETGVEGWRAVVDYARTAGKLTVDGLRTGGRAKTTVADPAITHYGIERVSEGIQVRVDNEGLAAAVDVAVQCYSGVPNDSRLHDTEEQVFTSIGTLDLGEVDAGESKSGIVPWMPSETGLWPVKCEVTASEDGYPPNSSAEQVMTVQ